MIFYENLWFFMIFYGLKKKNVFYVFLYFEESYDFHVFSNFYIIF